MHTIAPRRFNTVPLLSSIFINLGIGFTASLVTRPQIKGWYAGLNKPSFTPPNWLFGPVWTLIYLMLAVAAYLVWQRRVKGSLFARTQWIYIVQLLLNFSWSVVFFGGHLIMPALIVIGLLWLSIVINIIYFFKFNHWAAILLVPYLVWVSYASALNLYVYLLNR